MKRISTLLLIFFTVLFSQAQVSYPLVTIGPKYFTDGQEIYYLETTFLKKDGSTDIHSVNTQMTNNICGRDTLAWIANIKNVSGEKSAQISFRNDISISEGEIGGYLVLPNRNKGSKYISRDLGPGRKIWAEIKEAKLETFLGVTDSVKTISYRLVTDPGTGIIPEENIIDSMFFKISKKYGIIETRVQGCIQSQGILQRTIGRLGNKVKIIGLPAERLGWKPRLIHEFFNYRIGDKLYYSESNTQGMAMPCTTAGSVTIEISNKRVTKDSVNYEVKHQSQYTTVLCSAPVGFTYSGKHRIDSAERINTWTVSDDSRGEKISIYYYLYASRDSVMFKIDGCLNPMTYPQTSEYIFGKGLVSRTRQNGLGGEYRLNLAQMIIAGFSDYNPASEDCILSPNPASGSFTVTTSHYGLDLQLFDASGKQRLKVNALSEGANSISINNLEPGFYLYKILSGSNRVKTGKLIVH